MSVHEDELKCDALIETCEKVGSAAGEAMLVAQEPRKYASADGTGPSIASRGCVPILHMRHFQKNKVFSERWRETLPLDDRIEKISRAIQSRIVY